MAAKLQLDHPAGGRLGSLSLHVGSPHESLLGGLFCCMPTNSLCGWCEMSKIRVSRIKVPDDLLIPLLNEIRKDDSRTPASYFDREIEEIRFHLGPEYMAVPVEDIRHQAENLRKSNSLVPGPGHGPSKRQPLSDEYERHIKSDFYREIREMCFEHAEGRCQVCDDVAKECHHRSYDRMGTEHEWKDLIAVCKACHKQCDIRRKRHAKHPMKSQKALI